MIRDAVPADADAVAAIYAHHVLNGVATYDTEPLAPAAMQGKIAAVQDAGWPFLIAEAGGTVAGYAYATQMRDRPAYRFTAEDSIYVRHDLTGAGHGRVLLTALIDRAAAAGFRQMIAVIGGAEPASVALHAAHGFHEAGRLSGVGFKFGRWLDSIYMQRAIGG